MADTKLKATAKKATRKATPKPKVAAKAVTVTTSAPLVGAERTRYKGPDTTGGIIPQSFIKVYSSRGIEYLFMIISLAILTLGVILLGNDIISYLFNMDTVTGGADEWIGVEAATIVGGGFFLYIWSRLRAAETISPSILRDGSRKRALQRGLLLTFLGVLVAGFGFVYTILDLLSGTAETLSAQWESLLSASYTLAVVGLVFAFLFTQERKGE